MNRLKKAAHAPRRPAYRTEPSKPHQKALGFLKSKYHAFQGYSRRKKIAIIGGAGAAILIIIPPLSYLYFVRDINNKERLMNRNSTGITITDRNDEIIYSYGRTANEKLFTLDEISDDMEQALIASEDKTFYEHGGFSFRAIAGALVANALNKDINKYGGSTLTQQLVKNNLLTNDKNFLRKYQELSIAIAIERTYTKDEILEMYLNSVYYGEGAFGIERAAETYFDKTPQELTAAESAMLVGVLPAPSAYSPVSGDPDLAKQQQERVLTQMVETGYLTEEEKQTAVDTKLSYADNAEISQEHGHHFTAMIMDELTERYGEERVTRGGFSVKSSLDLEAQKHAEQTVKEQVAATSAAGASNASLVAIDPDTGEIKALVGSVDWTNEKFGQVNMSTNPRQPGSSFKPIYYAEALDKKLLTASSILKDERRTFGDYTPENYDFRFRGDVTLRHALALSLNIPAIEVMETVGVAEAAEAAGRMNIKHVDDPDAYGLTLALGTAETELLDMVNAYAAFANEGLQYEPTSILSIDDKYGKKIYEYEKESERVIGQEASYIISSILSDEGARAPLSGSALNLAGRKVAVKTGTTNDNVDALTIGYTPSLAVGVWVGNNNHKPMQVGGTAAAGPIWRSAMEQMLGDTATETFVRPGTVIEQNLCSVNGSYKEYYIDGTQPSDACYIPTQAELDAQRKKEEEERERKEAEDRQKEEDEEENTNIDNEVPEEPVTDPGEEEPPTEDPVNPEEPAAEDSGTGTGTGTTP